MEGKGAAAPGEAAPLGAARLAAGASAALDSAGLGQTETVSRDNWHWPLFTVAG